MFAIVALVCFILDVVGIGTINLLALGLVFVTLHLLVGSWPLGDRFAFPRRT